MVCVFFSLKGDQEFTYNGDRTKDEIVRFALRLSGPPVQEITRSQSFDVIKQDQDVYFLYVGEKSGYLWVRNSLKLCPSTSFVMDRNDIEWLLL